MVVSRATMPTGHDLEGGPDGPARRIEETRHGWRHRRRRVRGDVVPGVRRQRERELSVHLHDGSDRLDFQHEAGELAGSIPVVDLQRSPGNMQVRRLPDVVYAFRAVLPTAEPQPSGTGQFNASLPFDSGPVNLGLGNAPSSRHDVHGGRSDSMRLGARAWSCVHRRRCRHQRRQQPGLAGSA